MKKKRMMDGGMAKTMSRDEREDNDNMDEERVERREQRRERRGSDMREERRSEMMKRREARAAMTPEQRSAVRAERMAQIQKMGAGMKDRIRESMAKGIGGFRKPSPPVAGQPGIAPPVRPIIPQAAPMPAPALQKPAMRGGGLARKGVGQALRGGGLARKGVGQALKAGGAVRACGVAKRGKTKGKMV